MKKLTLFLTASLVLFFFGDLIPRAVWARSLAENVMLNIAKTQERMDYLEFTPPFDFAVDRETKGLSIDMIRMAAGKTGMDLKFINGHTWS